MIKMLTSAAKAFMGAVALLVMFSTTALAQDRVAEGAKKFTDNMKTQLALNDGQYAKVLEINKAFLQKAADSRKTAVTKVEKAKKLKTYDDERETKLKSVLTDTQYKTFAATRAENRKKLREYYESTQK